MVGRVRRMLSAVCSNDLGVGTDSSCVTCVNPYGSWDEQCAANYELCTMNYELRQTSGGYCGGVPPLPIPNREVKPACADGTAMQCGRVGGRRLFYGALLRQK